MRKLIYALGLAALGIALIAAAAVGAGGGISIVKKTTTTSGGSSSRTAKCGRHKHVLGGGFSAPGIGDLAQQSRPARKSGWKAATRTGPGDISAFALCERASRRDLRKVSKSVPLPGDPTTGPQRSVKAKCPRHWKVVSGGYAIAPPGDPSTWVDLDKRTSARTWKTHATNYGADAELQAFALCERKGQSKITQRPKTVVFNGPGTNTAVAKCPMGSHLVGGGYQGYPVNESRPVGPRKWKSRWSPGGPGSITSFAECES